MLKSLHRFFLSLSFRTHLILIVLLLSVPSVALIRYSGLEQRRDALNAGITETKMLVHGILREQYNMTGDAEQLVTTLAQLSDVKNRKVAATDAILSDILNLNQKFNNIVICDRSGEVWASALPFGKRVSYRNNRAFQKALTTRTFSSGEYEVGRISGKPGLAFAYPSIDERGEVAGVILVNVAFDYLNGLLAEGGLPQGSSFTLTDHRGIVIYKNLNSGAALGKVLDPSLFRRMQESADPVSYLDLGLAQKVIASCGKLRLRGESGPYLYVEAGIPTQGTLVKAWRAEWLKVALMSPILLVAVLLASLLGKFCFVNRINRLKNAAQRLAAGELGTRVSDLVGGGELGALGQAFDHMAQQLALRDRELSELNLSLTRRVDEETGRRLEQERLLARHARLAAIGEMIGAIAHQWRQPLATLGATIQSLRMAWERRVLDGSFLERAEADARKQLLYMSDTIEDFRNFFSPEKVAETFDVKEKVHEVSLLVAAQFANSQVTLEILDRAPDGPLLIRGFQNEFKQSVLNLVSNAFDAVLARIQQQAESGEPGRVAISLGQEPGWVLVEVTDNGCGIPAEIADKIYEPYFTSKPEGKGTGIGLYMSKLIVEESLGGTLRFASVPGNTVFGIALPQYQPGKEQDHG